LASKPKGDIEQRWIFTCGGCGAKRELRAQGRDYARYLVEQSGGYEHRQKGWLCSVCAVEARAGKQPKP